MIFFPLFHQHVFTPNHFIQNFVKTAIESVFADTEISYQERSKQAFEIHFYARLKSCTPKEADAMINTYKRVKRIFSESPDGSHNPFTNRIEISGAEAYSGTPIEFSTLAHELEHRLQSLRIPYLKRFGLKISRGCRSCVEY